MIVWSLRGKVESPASVVPAHPHKSLRASHGRSNRLTGSPPLNLQPAPPRRRARSSRASPSCRQVCRAHDERRGTRGYYLHVRWDAAPEIAVARQDRMIRQSSHSPRQTLARKRPAPCRWRSRAVSDEVEAEGVLRAPTAPAFRSGRSQPLNQERGFSPRVFDFKPRAISGFLQSPRPSPMRARGTSTRLRDAGGVCVPSACVAPGSSRSPFGVVGGCLRCEPFDSTR